MQPHKEPPLIVDLDGTLIKTDLLYEAANQFVTHHPFRIPILASWLISGKCVLKKRLAESSEVDCASLPYNPKVVSWIKQEKSGRNRHIVMATASHHTMAQQVASYLNCFDEVLATEGSTNLKAQLKRDLLISRFGQNAFDYVGNDHADLPVWRAARRTYVVSSSPPLIAQANAIGNVAQVFEDGKAPLGIPLFKTMRPHQWFKNLLLFVPLLTAHRYGDPASLIQSILAFAVFCFAASSVYVLNDLIDVTNDRHHPRKRHRPFAAGQLNLLCGWLVWPILLLFAFTVAATTLPLLFTGCLALYVFATLSYSLRLKKSAVIDVITLAGLYTLRIIAGAVALDAPLSFWILSFSMFIFLSLALMKRYSELKEGNGQSETGKVRGRGYHHSDLEIVSSLGTGSGYLSVLVLALYIQDSHAAAIYQTPQFIWLACPLLLYWISRNWLIAHRGEMHDDPVVFALKDKASWLVGSCFLLVFALARFVG